MDGLVDAIMGFIVNIALAAVIFYMGRWIASKVTPITRVILYKHGVAPILVNFSANVVHVGLLAFVVIAALGQLGIQTAPFVAVLGAAGLAIALAFQGSLSNLASGVLLVTFRPFKIGDFIEAGGVSGTVEKIEIFTTQIRTGDNKTIIVPNSGIAAGTIVNYSVKPTRRIDLVVSVGYGDDLDKVRKVIEDVLAADQRVHKDPAPAIGVLELADSSVDFAGRPWVDSGDYGAVKFDLLEALKKRFDAEGINIPFPQADVHLHQVA